MKRDYLLLVVALVVVFGLGAAYAQDAKKPPEKPLPDSVLIKAEDAKTFKENAQNAERTQLQVRALTAEIQLATKNLEELRARATKEQQELQAILFGLAEKHGLPQSRLSEYDLVEKDGGLLFTKKVAQKE